MTNIERTEYSGNTTEETLNFLDNIELMEIDEATHLFNELPENTRNNIMENCTIFDNENNVVEFITNKTLRGWIIDRIKSL